MRMQMQMGFMVYLKNWPTMKKQGKQRTLQMATRLIVLQVIACTKIPCSFFYRLLITIV